MLLALFAAAALGGCGSRAPLAVTPPLPPIAGLSGPEWQAVAQSLPAQLRPHSPNPCA